MQGYYQQPQIGGMGMGMDPRMQGQMGVGQQGYGQNMMGMQAMPGMQGIQGAMNPMMGGMGQGMGMGGMGGMGNAWRQLGYEYQLPVSGYKPDTSWGAWDLANAQYGGSGMDRSLLENLINNVGSFFDSRKLSEKHAKEAHRRVYFAGEGPESGSKTLGGAAAYQAFLLWDRDHHVAYTQMEQESNKERLIGLAYGELCRLWNAVQPSSSRFNMEEAHEHNAATAKNLFDRHYNRGNRSSGYFGDDDSDSGHRRKSFHGNMYGGMMPAGGGMQQGMMPQQGMMGQGGMGMQGMGMYPQAGGQMGMMGPMGGGGMGMGLQPGMGMGMGVGMGGMGQQGLAMGMIPMGGNGMSIGESQAVPGMHPYAYGTQSGVAWGNQPIDQMGNPSYPGGRYGGYGGGQGYGSNYGYGQPRYY